MKYQDIVAPTTEENRHVKGCVNVPVGYHNYLLDCACVFRKQEEKIKAMETELLQHQKRKAVVPHEAGVGQPKRHSVLESCFNVLVGYTIAIAAQCIIFPWFGINIPLHSNLAIGGYFTIISLARSYTLRRLFNWWHCRIVVVPQKPCPHGYLNWDYCPDCCH